LWQKGSYCEADLTNLNGYADNSGNARLQPPSVHQPPDSVSYKQQQHAQPHMAAPMCCVSHVMPPAPHHMPPNQPHGYSYMPSGQSYLVDQNRYPNSTRYYDPNYAYYPMPPHPMHYYYPQSRGIWEFAIIKDSLIHYLQRSLVIHSFLLSWSSPM